MHVVPADHVTAAQLTAAAAVLLLNACRDTCAINCVCCCSAERTAERQSGAGDVTAHGLGARQLEPPAADQRRHRGVSRALQPRAVVDARRRVASRARGRYVVTLTATMCASILDSRLVL